MRHQLLVVDTTIAPFLDGCMMQQRHDCIARQLHAYNKHTCRMIWAPLCSHCSKYSHESEIVTPILLTVATMRLPATTALERKLGSLRGSEKFNTADPHRFVQSKIPRRRYACMSDETTSWHATQRVTVWVAAAPIAPKAIAEPSKEKSRAKMNSSTFAVFELVGTPASDPLHMGALCTGAPWWLCVARLCISMAGWNGSHGNVSCPTDLTHRYTIP